MCGRYSTGTEFENIRFKRRLEELFSEAHGENIHHQNTGKVKQIKPKCAPNIFDCFAQWPVAEVTDSYQQQVGGAGKRSEHIAKQPPNLTFQDLCFVKAQKLIKNEAAIYHTHQDDKGVAQSNV